VIDKLAKLKSLLWDFLEASTPSRESKGWKRDDPSTWDNEGMCSIGSCTSGIINGKGVGHSEFNWEARTIPAVRKVFELIWGEEDLITSFDGANVFRPWHPDDPATCDRKTFGGWWHVDQGRRKAGARHAVQGLLSLFDQVQIRIPQNPTIISILTEPPLFIPQPTKIVTLNSPCTKE